MVVRELRFVRELQVSPETAWIWITDPDHMNQWSEAAIELRGDRRHVTVRSFGLRSELEEAVVESTPPKRFVYRVIEHPVIRDHRGELQLEPSSTGTRLTWTVRFRAVVPGADRVLEAILRPSLARSLDRLVNLVADRS